MNLEENHILIGLGGTGGKVLKAIRKRIYQEFPNDDDRAKLSIGYVYVDSTREMMIPGDPSFRVMGKDASVLTFSDRRQFRNWLQQCC